MRLTGEPYYLCQFMRNFATEFLNNITNFPPSFTNIPLLHYFDPNSQLDGESALIRFNYCTYTFTSQYIVRTYHQE